ncbi:hypothetical protein PMAYCL1PPCAC_16604, partial [Pristionchus mayeri]
DGHRLLHQLIRTFEDLLASDDASVVNQDVDVADLLLHEGGLRGDFLAVREVDGVRPHSSSAVAQHLLRLLIASSVHVPENDVAAELGELESHQSAKPGTGAGNQTDVALDALPRQDSSRQARLDHRDERDDERVADGHNELDDGHKHVVDDVH